MMSLNVKSKSCFIDGTLPYPSDSLLQMHWTRSNNLVLSWLLNSICKEIRSTLVYFNTPIDLWNDLKLRHLKSDGPRVFHLEKCLSTISQGGQSVTAYYNQFKTLWDEFMSHRHVIACPCNGCTCDIRNKMTNMKENDSVMKFLVGLHDSYVSIRSQILIQSPVPSLSKVYVIPLQEESQRCLQNYTNPIDSSVMFSRQHAPHQSVVPKPSFVGNQNYKDKKKLKCTACGFNGHTVYKCFHVVGYPPHWKGPRKFIDSSANANIIYSSVTSAPSSNAQNHIVTSNQSIANQKLFEQFSLLRKHKTLVCMFLQVLICFLQYNLLLQLENISL